MRNILCWVFCSLWMCLALPGMCVDWNGERAQAFAPILTNLSFQQLLLSHAKPLTRDFSYARLMGNDTDVLLVGEEHHDSIPAREVNLMIKELSKESGLTHVASEFLLAQEQPFLDKFASGEIDYETLRSQCTLARRTFVARVAKRYGVRVIGLDVSRDRERYYDWATSESGCRRATNSGKIFW
ncbi:MAG: ChaN family lipoprotein [Elusimicrobiaceae bacterium]|nr:ChaN family lipoprotein [Elusimicrobiaceae bacterium]